MELLDTFIPIYVYANFGAIGATLIFGFFYFFLLILRHIIQCIVERPGDKSVSKRTILFLNIFYLFEGLICYLFAFSISTFAILPCVFSRLHVAASAVIAGVVVAISITHSCRERHLLNAEILWKEEIGELDEENEEEKALKQDGTNEGGDKSIKRYRPNVCLRWIVDYFESVRRGIAKKIIIYIITVVIGVVLVVGVTMGLSGGCITTGPYSFSSQIYRLIEGPSCSNGEICTTHVLLAENTHEEMIIKFQSRDAPIVNGSYVLYDTDSTSEYRFKQFCTVDHAYFIVEESRYISTCSLVNLLPNTTYYFRADTNQNITNITTSEYKFKTLHDSPTEEIQFVASGDKYVNSEATTLLKLIAEQDPAFIIIGGDIAYHNGDPNCYKRFDYVMKELQEIRSPSGHMIPLLTCIGNHEAFENRYEQTRHQSIQYIYFFTHEVNKSGLESPLHHIHKIAGHSSVVALDSSIIETHQEQVPYLEQVWSNPVYANRKSKFALYHVPLYPSKRDIEFPYTAAGRQHWEPIFKKYNLTVGLENHDHLLKRTKPMDGIVYIGDGALGSARSEVGEIKDYMEVVKAENHFWKIAVNSTIIKMTAYGVNGQVLDSTELQL